MNAAPFGAGGSPATSVYMKAGVTPAKPVATQVEEDYWQYDPTVVEKGNQSNDGANVKNIGNADNLVGTCTERRYAVLLNCLVFLKCYAFFQERVNG